MILAFTAYDYDPGTADMYRALTNFVQERGGSGLLTRRFRFTVRLGCIPGGTLTLRRKTAVLETAVDSSLRDLLKWVTDVCTSDRFFKRCEENAHDARECS